MRMQRSHPFCRNENKIGREVEGSGRRCRNGEVIGQDATDATIRQIAGWISDKVEPPISPTIDHLADEDVKAYIRVAFSGMDAPYSADGRYFTRVGTSNKQMAVSETGRPTRQACSSASACLPRTARSPTPAP